MLPNYTGVDPKQWGVPIYERGFDSLLDPPPYTENLPKIIENNFKVSRKVGFNSVSVIFVFALFWIFCESAISQTRPLSRTVLLFSKQATHPQTNIFRKSRPHMWPQPNPLGRK